MKITDLPVITSKGNSKLKLARAVRDGRERELMFVEGVRLVRELLRSRINAETVLVSQAAAEKLEDLMDGLAAEIHLVSANVFDSIIDTESSQGIIALAKRPEGSDLKQAINADGLVVYLYRAGNPSNLGAIIRTAEAAGVTALILSPGSADPYSPKALRASMGSAFRQPIFTGVELSACLELAGEVGLKTVAVDIEGSLSYSDLKWEGGKLLTFGSEAHGLDREWVNHMDETINIPMENSVESLNLAVSAGIVLFEAKRQRHQIKV